MIYSIGMNKKIGPTQPVLISIFGMFDFIMENNKTSLLHTQDTKVGLDYLHWRVSNIVASKLGY